MNEIIKQALERKIGTQPVPYFNREAMRYVEVTMIEQS